MPISNLDKSDVAVFDETALSAAADIFISAVVAPDLSALRRMTPEQLVNAAAAIARERIAQSVAEMFRSKGAAQ